MQPILHCFHATPAFQYYLRSGELTIPRQPTASCEWRVCVAPNGRQCCLAAGRHAERACARVHSSISAVGACVRRTWNKRRMADRIDRGNNCWQLIANCCGVIDSRWIFWVFILPQKYCLICKPCGACWHNWKVLATQIALCCGQDDARCRVPTWLYVYVHCNFIGNNLIISIAFGILIDFGCSEWLHVLHDNLLQLLLWHWLVARYWRAYEHNECGSVAIWSPTVTITCHMWGMQRIRYAFI